VVARRRAEHPDATWRCRPRHGIGSAQTCVARI
jgi:hypothetical protein